MLIRSGNPILDKNLEGIARYNEELVEKLLEIKSLKNNIVVDSTKLDEPNLIYNGIPLHSEYGAEKEVQNVFKEVINTKRSIHIVLGMGLGYLFKECCEKSKGRIFLYESNLEILRVTLEIVDFSKELMQNNVFISSDIEFLKLLYYSIYNYRLKYAILALESYKNCIYKDTFDDVIKQIKMLGVTIDGDFEILKLEEFDSLKMIMDNMPKLIKSTPLNELFDRFTGKTALIISAGPTLDRNIETIKKNREKVVIFCVGQALKALQRNGIQPDFVHAVEQKDFSGQLNCCDMSDINLVLEPFSHKAFYQFNVKQLFLFPSIIRNANQIWAKLSDSDISRFCGRGTVSHEALECAKLLGFKTLILVGQDLAYIDNNCYAKDSAYGEFKIETNSNGEIQVESKVESLDAYKSVLDKDGDTENAQKLIAKKLALTKSKLTYVKGISGEMIPSQIDYAMFITNFNDFAYEAEESDLKLINSSMVGAQIDGFENIPLEEALKDAPLIENRNFQTDFRFDKAKIIKNLAKELSTLQNILYNSQIAQDYLIEYKKQFEQNKEITSNSIDNLKKLLDVYKKLNDSHNIFVKAITLNDAIEVDLIIDETEDFTLESVGELHKALKNYFSNLFEKGIEIVDKMKETINILKSN